MKLSDRIAKLFEVKSLLSIAAATVFVTQSLNGSLESKDVMLIIVLVFQAFFSYQTNKPKE